MPEYDPSLYGGGIKEGRRRKPVGGRLKVLGAAINGYEGDPDKLRYDLEKLAVINPTLAQALLDIAGDLSLTASPLVDTSMPEDNQGTNEAPRTELYPFPTHNAAVAAEVMQRVNYADTRLIHPEYRPFNPEHPGAIGMQLENYSQYLVRLFEGTDRVSRLHQEFIITAHILSNPDLLNFAQTTPGMGGNGFLLYRVEDNFISSNKLPMAENNIMYQEFVLWFRRFIVEYVASRTVNSGDPYGKDMPEGMDMYDNVLDVPTTLVMGGIGSGKSTCVQELMRLFAELNRNSTPENNSQLFNPKVGMPAGFDAGDLKKGFMGMILGKIPNLTRLLCVIKPWGFAIPLDSSSPDRLIKTMKSFIKNGNRLGDTHTIVAEQPAFWDTDNPPASIAHEVKKWEINRGPYINSLILSLLAKHRGYVNGIFMLSKISTLNTSKSGRNNSVQVDNMQLFYDWFSKIPDTARLMVLVSAVFNLPVAAIDDPANLIIPKPAVQGSGGIEASILRTEKGKGRNIAYRLLDKYHRRTVRTFASLLRLGLFDYCVYREEVRGMEGNFYRGGDEFAEIFNYIALPSNLAKFLKRLGSVEAYNLRSVIHTLKTIGNITNPGEASSTSDA